MANLPIIDGTATAGFRKATGAGSDPDPFVEHAIIDSGDVNVLTLPSLPAGDNDIGNVDVLTLPSLPAGTNNIGDVDVLTLPSLPAGDNNIGNVDVLTLPSLPAGTNNIGDVDVLTLPSLPAGTNNIGDVDVLTLPAAYNAGAADAQTLRTISASDDPVVANQAIIIALLRTLRGSTPAHNTSSANAIATFTISAPGASNYTQIVDIDFGYSATPATGTTLTISATGMTTKVFPITSSGPGIAKYSIRVPINTAVTFLLSAGGTGVIGYCGCTYNTVTV